MSIVRVSLFFFAFIPWNPVFHTWLKKGWITSAHSLCCGREEEHRTRATEPFIMGCDHGCTLLPWERVFLIYWTRSWEATLSLPSKPRSKPDTWETPSLYFKGFAIQTLLQNSSEKRKKKKALSALFPRFADMWEIQWRTEYREKYLNCLYTLFWLSSPSLFCLYHNWQNGQKTLGIFQHCNEKRNNSLPLLISYFSGKGYMICPISSVLQLIPHYKSQLIKVQWVQRTNVKYSHD